nr:G-type lectin S-receptor-like serine/threonine-protein kinase SD1-1 [Ziziphus jujuba var. spinosa]
MFDLKNETAKSRMVVNLTNGYNRIHYAWNSGTQSWEVFASVPRDTCDTYGLCGAYGNCIIGESPVCQCLTGFKPKGNFIDWSQGCVQNKPFDFQDKRSSWFVNIRGLKLPDATYTWGNASVNLKECKTKCLSNCFCTAYTNSDIHGKGSGANIERKVKIIVSVLAVIFVVCGIFLVAHYIRKVRATRGLQDQTKSKLLDWSKRYHIICGIARGLLYLHQGSRLRIIHRDIKASNILLDNEMNPKISDFGMAKTFGGDPSEGNTKECGYMASEYAIDGFFLMEYDVFSFGILLLEIISGNKNKGSIIQTIIKTLLDKHGECGKKADLWNLSIRASRTQAIFLRCCAAFILVCCVCKNTLKSMSYIVVMLGSESALPQPKQPGFSLDKTNVAADSSPNRTEASSTNEITITLLEPR